MANWCSNTVVFEGSPEAIEQIEQLFKSMVEKQQHDGCGQLPDFVTDDNGGYFFDLYPQDNETGIYHYETKWSTNTEVLQKIAERYSVNFSQDYEEVSNHVYGRATYSDKLLTDIYLEYEDFEKFHFDQETDTYHFEGESYESQYEIVEALLERKINNHFSSIKN